MGMFILVWFIKAPDWKQHRDLLMTEGWTNCSRPTAGNKEKRSKFQKVPRHVVPLTWEEIIIEMENRLGKERERTRCVERQGQPDDPCGDGSALMFTMTSTPRVWILLQFPNVLREAEREIRELGKGYVALLTHAIFVNSVQPTIS